MKKIIIIGACVVMLVALGFAAWKLYLSSTHENSKTSAEKATFVAERWNLVGAKWDGSKLIGYPDPLQKMDITELPNKELTMVEACDWIETSFYSNDGNGDVTETDSRFVYRTLDELVEFLKKDSSSLQVIDQASRKDVYAKVDDCLLLLSKDHSKAELPNGYQFLEDGDSRYRFQIYKVKNAGAQLVDFTFDNDNGTPTDAVVNVYVSK